MPSSSTTYDIPSDYPDQLRRVRGRLGLPQTHLAQMLGVTPATVARWESGTAQPSLQVWRRIMRLDETGVDAADRPDSEDTALREPDLLYAAMSGDTPDIDFAADAEVVRSVAEGYRLTYGYLFNPSFATEISRIDPVPHQYIAVYDHMLPQSRLRFLLADDAGAGKTIMTGLYMREMLSRRLISRVLIVPPAGLASNWERELDKLFNLSFRRVAGSEARDGNPFVGVDSDRLIVSIDTLAGERMFTRLQERDVLPYDLVVFDEAHKLSADREPDMHLRKTDRYRLAEALAGLEVDDARWQLSWSAHHLLLLTATPHMGKDFPYYCLWRLLEPEALSTVDAFNAYPAAARQRHFIRRSKEEMVRLDDSAIYPTRVSDTLSYDLTQGEISEQALYDQTTDYIRDYYNRAGLLNRSAARLVMTIFQRRLASSTAALMESFQRRQQRLDGLIDDIRSGRITPDQLVAQQRRLAVRDVLDEKTADEEEGGDGREESEAAEDDALAAVVARNLAELEIERREVARLLKLARQVYDAGDSKFDRLCQVLREPQHKGLKLIIFTEHRDTLMFLVRKLEGLGYTGQVGHIHGGMDSRERDAQQALFWKPVAEGGTTILVATDAAGEGINLQVCWLMINYDIPWNPARLEQRMGRIHRYGQTHDPVIILNLVAGKTREGRVLKVLLEKLERIRKELRSDKVFDVVGRVFEGVSLSAYMQNALTDEGANQAVQQIDGVLTKEQIEALRQRERRLFGDGGDVRSVLPALRARQQRDEFRRLLPGYVRRFVEKAAPLIDLRIEGDLDGVFALHAVKAQTFDLLWPTLESYPPEQRGRFSVARPRQADQAIWLHPGDPFFDRLRAYVCSRFGQAALRGGVFVDPTAQTPYLFHLALISIERKADAALQGLSQNEAIEYRLVGLRDDGGSVTACPVEHLLLLRPGRLSPAAIATAATALASRAAALTAAEEIALSLAEAHRQRLLHDLPERERFITTGYEYEEVELMTVRARLTQKAAEGNARASADLTRIKARQRAQASRREHTLAVLRREPELIAPGEVIFLAHALVAPSSDPEDKKRHDEDIEAIAVRLALAHEEAAGALVKDVSTPEKARAAGLTDRPGFDLLSTRPGGQERGIEVKGRAGVGDVELSENEWVKACNLRERFWLYVVYDCATPTPRLLRVPDPFANLIVRAKGSVIVDEQSIFVAAAEW